MKKSLLLLCVFVLTASFSAQEISISSTDSYTACEGAVVDSGLSAADYGANENETITWCPEAPETVLNLYWVVFDLDAASTITLYDGDDNNAPLIGSYTGDELQGQDISQEWIILQVVLQLNSLQEQGVLVISELMHLVVTLVTVPLQL